MIEYTIHKAAYDGNLEEVKRMLSLNRRLLDAKFQENNILAIPASHIVYGAKKVVAGIFGFFAVGFTAVITTATVLPGVLLASGSAVMTRVTWETGDADLAYFKRDLTNWRPLDCAAYGYANGNEAALSVALYLIEQGAEGACCTNNPNKKFYETLATPIFKQACQMAFSGRDTSSLLTLALADQNTAEQKRQALLEEQQKLLKQLNGSKAAQKALRNRLEVVQAELQALSIELDAAKDNMKTTEITLRKVNAYVRGLDQIGVTPSGLPLLVQRKPDAPLLESIKNTVMSLFQ